MTKIKFCKALSDEDIFLAEKLSVDFAGVHAIKEDYDSRLPLPRLAQLIAATGVELVALTKDVNLTWLHYITTVLGYKYVQIHTRLNKPSLDILHRFHDKCRFIFMIDPSEAGNAEYISAIEPIASYLLFDQSQGGTGIPIQIDATSELVGRISVPFFIAGGLNTQNVGNVVTALKPFAVDVQSSIRENRHWNAAKARSFVQAVREATQ